MLVPISYVHSEQLCNISESVTVSVSEDQDTKANVSEPFGPWVGTGEVGMCPPLLHRTLTWLSRGMYLLNVFVLQAAHKFSFQI